MPIPRWIHRSDRYWRTPEGLSTWIAVYKRLQAEGIVTADLSVGRQFLPDRAPRSRLYPWSGAIRDLGRRTAWQASFGRWPTSATKSLEGDEYPWIFRRLAVVPISAVHRVLFCRSSTAPVRLMDDGGVNLTS